MGIDIFPLQLIAFSIEVIICEAQDEDMTTKVAPFLLLSRTMETFRAYGLADAIEKESERYIGP
jgi:hypothetical protein